MMSNQSNSDDSDAIARVDWSRTDQVLDYLEQSCGSSRQIALLRIRLLSSTTTSTTTTTTPRPGAAAAPTDLASCLLPVLSNVVDDFEKQPRAVVAPESLTVVAHCLMRVLKLVRRLVQQDPTLAEEIGRQGAHVYLTRLMNGAPPPPPQLEPSGESAAAAEVDLEAYDDIVEEIQELAGEIAVASRPYFPMAHQPFSATELKARLPLVFTMPNGNSRDKESEPDSTSNSILVRQVTTRQSAQDDVGFGQ
jgi:hypothetical protein